MRDDSVRFDWDCKKASSNLRKHKVSFEEASTVFRDDFAQQFEDPDHSEEECRFIMLGLSSKLRTVVVCFCYRTDEDVIRLFSARKADKDEATEYFKGRSK